MRDILWTIFMLVVGLVLGVSAEKTIHPTGYETGQKRCSTNGGTKTLQVSALATNLHLTCNNGAEFTIDNK